MTPSDLPPSRLTPLTACVAVITVILAAFALWALRHILTPFILAVFLLLMIGGLETALMRRARLPVWAALPAAIVVVVAFFGVSIWLIVVNTGHMVGDFGLYGAKLDQVLKMGSARLGIGAAPTIDELFRHLNPTQYLRPLAEGAGHLVEGAVLVLIYLAFMLAARTSFSRKLTELFTDGGESEAAVVFDRIQHGVAGYIFIQTLVGLMIAALSAGLMLVAGLSHVLFFAFVIFVANYIPAIGVAIGVLLPPLFGLLELGSVWPMLLLFVALEVVHFVISHGVQPRLQGQSLNIDPIVVLLSLAFWGVLFGLTGAFLSTPLTVIVMAVCAEFPATRGIAILLSADGRPYVQ